MSKNTGKPSEQKFLSAYRRLGKRAFLHRFVDAAEIKGKTGKVAVSASSQPSDYLVTEDGKTYFAEVKCTQNATSFPFSVLQKTQSADAKMILAAGGEYWVFAHSLALKRWFKFPYQLVEQVKAGGKSSIKWQDLAPYLWTLADG